MVNGDFVLHDPGASPIIVKAPDTIVADDRFALHHSNTNASPGKLTFDRNSHTVRYKGDAVGDDIELEDGDTIEIICRSSSLMEIV